MKKIILLVFVLLFGLNIQAQRQRGRGNMNGIPQTQSEPSERDIAKRKLEMEERRNEYVDNFLSTLEADEFQKHIIKQNIFSFFEAKVALFKTKFEHELDRQKAIKHLTDTHFKDLEELISEGDMTKIKEMIKGEFKEKEVVKEKKRKKKRRKKNKD